MECQDPSANHPTGPQQSIEPGIYRGSGGIREILGMKGEQVEFVQLAGNVPSQSRASDVQGRAIYLLPLVSFRNWVSSKVQDLEAAYSELTEEVRLLPQSRLLLTQAQQTEGGWFRATAAETRLVSAMCNQCIVEAMESDGRFRLTRFGQVVRERLLASVPGVASVESSERVYDRRIDELRKAGHSIVMACSLVFAEIEAGELDVRLRQHALHRLHKAIRAAESTAIAREAARPIFESVERRIEVLKASFEQISHEERAAAIAAINQLVAAELTPAERAIRAVSTRAV